MPKKTREEKIVARYRKKIRLLEQQAHSPSIETINKITKPNPKPPIIKEPTQSIDKISASTKTDESLRKFFVKDLTKSLLLIVLIVALEISLYFVRIK